MTHDRYAQVLRDLQQEREEAEHELAALQLRVDALREATEGIEKLVRSERNIPSQAPPDARPPPPPAKPRSTGDGALVIIQSDTSRYWTVRQVWEEMVKREWAGDARDARDAVRIALVRLAKKHVGQLERVPAGATFAYRWNGDTNSNGHPALPGSQAWQVAPAGRTDS